MKKYLALLLILISTMYCVSTPVPGALVTITTQHVQDKQRGSLLGSGKIEKMGQSCNYGGLLLLTQYVGGSTIKEAMEEAGIKKIAVIDRSSLQFIGSLFFRDCTQVWGE